MKEVNLKKYFTYIVGIHVLPIIILYFITCFNLEYISVPLYSLFVLSFTLPLVSSLYDIVKNERGYFFYILSILFFLGFVGKFSIHEIFRYDYVEPIGSFIFNKESMDEVLRVGIVGILGFFASHLSYVRIFLHKKTVRREVVSNSSKWIVKIGLVLITAVLASLNLEYNILLFGAVPSEDLPLYGNVIFFLVLTRGMGFLYSYHFMCKPSPLNITIGAFIMLIASVGVLSRMFIVVYFIVAFVFFVSYFKYFNVTKILKILTISTLSFLVFSIFAVLLSSSLRLEDTSKKSSLLNRGYEIVTNLHDINVRTMIGRYSQLAIDRWIGMEGVMAVSSYPKKELSLLKDGLLEKSYRGNSFYTKISTPRSLNKELVANTKISTSVPGPIAFFFYSGSLIIVFLGMFLMPLVIYSLLYFTKYFVSYNTFTNVYLSAFFAFDFFQFGISPKSFLYYCLFTVLATFIYKILFLKVKKIRKK